MRLLEARFHSKRNAEYVVVGYLRWHRDPERDSPVIEVKATLGSVAGSQLLSKLQYLVRLTSPGAFERLQDLHSEFWSFVEVRSATRAENAVNG